jgi:hypothetical protein
MPNNRLFRCRPGALHVFARASCHQSVVPLFREAVHLHPQHPRQLPQRLHAPALGPAPSSPGEFHPEALTEPYVTVSRHTARVTP